MILINWSGLIAFAVWFVLVVGIVLPLTGLALDIAFNGRPVMPVEDRPEVTFVGTD